VRRRAVETLRTAPIGRWAKVRRDQFRLLSPRQRAVASLFDESFYRESYPDVASAGLNPLRHFVGRGWREGRDPSADFSTSDYLSDNPDVRTEGINPLLHYVREGRGEGRKVRPSRLVPDSTRQKQELLTRLFDETFYRASNPDIAANVSAIEHYRTWGWQQGRDPTPWFNVRFYLATNPDVRLADVEPFAHYLSSGKLEGRPPRDPILFDRAGFMQVGSAQLADRKRQLLRRVDGRAHSRPKPLLSLDALPNLPDRPVVLAIGNTDYTANIGGVETCATDEQRRLTRHGHHYLYLAPHEASLPLRPDGNYNLTLILDGDVIGVLPASRLEIGLSSPAVRSKVARVAVHGLLGHHPTTLASAISGLPVDYWIHDYFALCINPALTRSGLDFCGAPPPESGACRLCSFGKGRADHLAELSSFLQISGARPVAPSSFAAELWASMMGWPDDDVRVVPHGRIDPSSTDQSSRGRRGRPRLAFVGGPVHAKGWDAFTEVARWALSRQDIELFHFGQVAPRHPGVRHVATEYRDSTSLTRKISEWDIDAVLIWPTWPETFSLVAYEVMAGGASVVTHPASGNVLPAALAEGKAIVLDDDRALRRAAITGSLAALLREASPAQGIRGEFVYDGLTPALLGLS
jgi:hypothetical protein